MRYRTQDFIAKTTAFIQEFRECNAVNVGHVESIWEMENGDLEWVASLCKDAENKVCYEAYYNYSTNEFILGEYTLDEELSKHYSCDTEDGRIYCDSGFYCGVDSYRIDFHYDTYTGTVYETFDDGRVAVYAKTTEILVDILGEPEEEIINTINVKWERGF